MTMFNVGRFQVSADFTPARISFTYRPGQSVAAGDELDTQERFNLDQQVDTHLAALGSEYAALRLPPSLWGRY